MQLANAAFGKQFNSFGLVKFWIITCISGERLGNTLAKVQIMYLSQGTCIALIIIGGSTSKLFMQIVCRDSSCKAETLTTTEWYLVFTCGAILLSQLPNLNSIAGVSMVGAFTAVGYCTLIWVVSVAKGKVSNVSYDTIKATSEISSVFNIFNALGIVGFAFRGHNLILEIQVIIFFNYCYLDTRDK
ncbi:putative amino acid transporter, transmembrane domain-containing protein [Helianthus annuus]|nr:putative amino acid transporter, transmembrane domain-containing protein [Helianthus annuus]